ncbi:hypothetical protein P3T76_006465 [Phytophthora citrophthora]|uniref:Uncharacterized protein n=1 Tax=Phytophthora citrophthora TaxID=4793 RepID=A0AAD9LM50_9STRA|nr:hypothetical protein P3T76_006465 [Phytophthora citrophthora]
MRPTSSPIRRRTPSSPSKFPPIKKSKLLSPKTTVRANGKVSLPKVSSVTFDTSQELDSGEELEILKCILVREGYLQRLARASSAGHIAGAHLSETVDVLDLLRLATLETVEAVVTWRTHKQKSNKSELEQFKWNGINYLLKLASDLEFLEKHSGLVAWLGFTLQRNPFVLPLNLDCRAKLISPSAERVATGDSNRFLQVGGKRLHSTDVTGDSDKAEAEALALALADRRRAKTPYETRVLNDEELLPYASSFGVDRPKSRAPRGRTKYSSVLPSQIGEEDIARLCEAERVVLHEEAAFGRFARDIHGRVVPEDEAQRRFSMVELSGNAYNVPDSLQSSYTEDSEGELRLREQPQSEIPGKAHAKKRSGMLGPISKPNWRAFDRPPAPRRRARGAQLEEALAAERKVNAQLGVLLDSMKEEMERKAMDIAYFESCSELRGYSDELRAFTIQAQRELDALHKEFQLKNNLYESKTVNVQKKEELLNTFKTQHKAIVDKSHVERIEASKLPSFNQQQQHREDQEQEAIRAAAAIERRQHERSTPLVQHFCATQIQKLARGMLARQAFEQMKIEFVVASTYIQAGVRGFLVRRRVAKMYWHRAASIHLQRVARGFLARQFTKKKRLERQQEQAARQIQRVVRGHFGRVRMIKIRELVGWRLQLALAGRSINAVALKELADACQTMVSVPNLMKTEGKAEERPLPALVLGLVRLLMLFTSDSDEEWDIPNVRWREASRFLRCGVGVARRMQRISDSVAGAARALMASSGGFAATGVAASTPYLRKSALGLALLKAFKGDLDFKVETFERIPNGWQAAVALFKWTTAFCAIVKLQHLLEASKNGFLVVSQTLSKREAQQERTERQEADHSEEVQARRFVPLELVQAHGYPFHRSRPLLLVVANDVPKKARSAVVEKLEVALPGLFVTITRPPAFTRRSLGAQDASQPFDFEAVRGALAVGHSVILEGDVGLRDVTQRAFLSCFATIKHGLNPPPTCVLLRGTITNRSDLFGPKQGSDMEEEMYRQEMTRRMVDADLRMALDRTTRLRLELGSESVTCAMAEQASDPAPAPALVVVMEAVVVLLTPGKDYEGPSQSDFATSSVSWRLSRRLLAEPAHLRFKLQQVDVTMIPSVNLRALERYLCHSLWPNAEISRSQTSSTRLLYALASWVEAAVGTAQLIAAEGTGLLAPEITRFGPVPGLFERVVVFNNCPTNIEQEGAGEDSAVVQLMDAVLADVRVYRTAHMLVHSRVNSSSKKNEKMADDGEERCVVTIFHDCRRIFASVYTPSSGQSWMTVISEDDIDHLLTPTGRQDKLPPKSHAEMYARLAKLCLLQKRKVGSHPESVEAPNPYELVLRPASIRLYRHVLQLGGFLTTVTIAEISRGHVQVDAFVHSSSQSSAQGVTLTLAVELENILGRLSAAQARREFIPAPRLPSIILDRLHLYCATRTQLRAQELEKAELSLRLSVRTGESSPGRVLLRRAVRVPGSHEVAERWVFTLVERHDDGEFQAVFYSPSSSTYQSIHLSSSAAQELLHLSRHSTPSQLEQVLVRSFCRVKPVPKQVDVEDSDTEDEDPQEADTIARYRLRRRIIARFPCSLHVLKDPHQLVTKRKIVRAYVQVELGDREPVDGEKATHPRVDTICYRMWLPGSCLEQSLVLQPSEVDASLREGLPWQYSSLRERRISSRDLVRQYFHWDPNGGTGENGCVVAHLPVGSFWATERASVSDRQPVAVDQLQHQSHRSSDTQLPVVSCTRLLDDRDTESDDEDEVRDHKKIYCYDNEELVHRGSYRANGLYVIVRTTMRAEVLRDLQPALASPTDRVRERDSFAITLYVYHPASSSSATVGIRGHRDLREVVGPDQPSLISSCTLDSLMRHIILRRLGVQVDRTNGLEVTFLRDRLYAKQKATPVTKTFERDSAVNAAKLIDEARRKGKAGERGTKVLTTAKILPGCGQVLLTVFDMATNRQSMMLRVDAYVCATSARLSLLLEGSDLVHVVGDEDKELLLPVSYSDLDAAGIEEIQNQTSRKLAVLVLEYLRVDQRSDGRGARLVLSDYSSFQSDSANAEVNSTRLFKTVRAVGRDQVLLSGYLEQVESTNSLSLRLELYEPAGSSRCRMTISQFTLSAMLGLPQLPELDQIVKEADRDHLTTHICSLLHIEKLSAISDGAVDNPPTFAMTLEFDEKRAVECVKQHMSCDSGDVQAPQYAWTGLTTSTEDVLLSVHLQLLHSDSTSATRRRLMCSTYAPADFLVNARTFEWGEIPAELLSLVEQEVSDYTPFFTMVCKQLRVQVQYDDEETSTSASQARSIRINFR